VQLPNFTKPQFRRDLLSHGALLYAVAICSICGCSWSAQSANISGVQMFQQGNYQAADSYFRQALQADPMNADGHYNLAANFHRQWKLHQRPADLHQAEMNYQQCLLRNPQHVDCYRGMAVLMVEQGRTQDAFNLLEQWAASAPVSAEPRIELARLYEEFGDKETAKTRLIDAVAVAPQNARALAALGKLREESGDTVQALSNYQRSLASNINQPQVAARVAMLQGSGLGAPNYSSPGDSRWVAAPGGTVR
jgi:tetratricopeptide (TPR) repeat protein